MAEPKNPGAAEAATGARRCHQAGLLRHSEPTSPHDYSQLRTELLQQQRQALQAALRHKAEHHGDEFLGLAPGFLSLIASLETALAALDRLEREGGL